jgi:hypothetical protein
MLPRLIPFLIVCFGLFASFTPLSPAYAVTAQEILQQVVKQSFGDNFRISVKVRTERAKKTTENVMWLVGRIKDGDADFFVDFEEPKDSKGLRFLFLTKKGSEPKAFMYVPATKKTIQLSMNDPSADMGATGLTMEDIQGFIPHEGEKATLEKEEKLDGKYDCWVIRITLPQNKTERLLWVSKKDHIVMKSQHIAPDGKVKRTFKVMQLFKTEQGREFPREEEITIPDKNAKIKLRQESAVFGIEVPDEIMDPEQFGIYKWRL